MTIIKVPYEKIPPETLARLIENFICREGTDYGQGEFTLSQKVKQVKNQLITNKASITFDTETSTTSIVTQEQLNHCNELLS